MKRNQKRFIQSSSKGFTLIEVVLVLAIGGLIFLLAFLAFQQVSTNRRDTQRRSDAGRVLAELQNFAGDRGSVPATSVADEEPCTAPTTSGTTFKLFTATYLCNAGVFMQSPSGSAYKVIAGGTAFTADDVDKIKYTKNKGCDNKTGANKVEIALENGVVCRDDR